MEPNSTVAPAQPAATPAAPPPTAPTPTPPPPPPASAPVAAAPGSGASGGMGTGGQPTPAPSSQGAAGVQGFGAANSPATQAAGAATASPAAIDWEARARQYEQQLSQQAHFAQLGYQQWQRTQQQQPAQPQVPPPPPSVFGVAEFDHNMLSMLRRDENGQIVATPGAPPGLAAQYERYVQTRADAERRFWSNPLSLFESGPVKDYIGKMVTEQARQLLDQHRQVQTAQSIVSQHYKDFVVHDPSGRPVYDYTADGQRTERLTPEGQYYIEQANDARSMGISDPQRIHKYAMERVQIAKWQLQQQQQAAAQQGQQTAQQFATAPAAAAPATPAAHTPNVASHPAAPQTLEQKMLQMFRQGGYTDERLMSEMTQR